MRKYNVSTILFLEILNQLTYEIAEYFEEVLRRLYYMMAPLKENNDILKKHKSTTEELSERVRRIDITTSNLW